MFNVLKSTIQDLFYWVTLVRKCGVSFICGLRMKQSYYANMPFIIND
uniref:Uncharacterized protein n=1 Tax=Rhinopithecus bieti TaxID=61621 RepID=A0A2K6MQX0_RHIBE